MTPSIAYKCDDTTPTNSRTLKATMPAARFGLSNSPRVAYPGSPDIYKSYAYIYGLLESIDFVMERDDRFIVYNYVETPTETLRALVRQTKVFLGSWAPVCRVPLALLRPAASVAQSFLGPSNPLHPVRVRKAAMSTHIVPAVLKDLGFEFRFPFLKSLEHWRSITPSISRPEYGRGRPG